MKIAIIENEKNNADLLDKYLLNWSKYKQVPLEIKRYPDTEQFLSDRKSGSGFDVLFIDIQMRETDNMDTAEKIKKKNNKINIIFMTGINGYMADSYKENSIHYLVKPFNKDKIYLYMDKILDKKENMDYVIVHSRNNKDEIYKLDASRINYILAMEHTSIIESYKNEDNDKQLQVTFAAESISELEPIVKKYGIIKCHHSYLCGIQNIDHIGKRKIVFDIGTYIPVSRRFYKDVHQAFVQYFSNLLRERNSYWNIK